MKAALQIHDYKLVYLVVRTFDVRFIQSVAYQQAEIQEVLTKMTAVVYDLPMNYKDLDSLKDILQSSQLGTVSQQLHNDDVDFTNITQGISGALQGTSCAEHHWWIQLDVSVNCKDESFHIMCIQEKISTDNIIKFANMKFLPSSEYFICVHANGGKCNPLKVCSNGFIIDTTPPLPGNVYVVNGLSDTTAMLINWEGFQDIETEISIPYSDGIKEYLYAIGKNTSL